MQGCHVPRLTFQCPRSNLNTFLMGEEVVHWVLVLGDLVPRLLVAVS